MRPAPAIILAAALGVAWPAFAAAPAPASAASAPARHVGVANGPIAVAIDAQLTEAARHGFGGAVIIEIDGRTVLSGGYGLADREAKTPFTPQTIAQIGSITKTFTALAISQLAAAGRIDLKAPLKTYLPEAAEPGASITLEQLLTHQSGLIDDCGEDFDRITRSDLLTRCLAKPLVRPTGTYGYSNIGYATLAAVVERVSGQPWEAYLAEHVWRPFGMSRTGWQFPGRPRRDFAVGYLKDAPQGVISDRIAAMNGEVWNLKGDGGLQASAADMQRLYHGLQGQPAAVRALMLSPHAHGEADAMEGYGLFFRFDDKGALARVGHGGSDGVFFSYFCWLPQKKAFFYFVGNNGEDEVKPALQVALRTLTKGPQPPAKP